MGKSSRPPAPPDPRQVARAQTDVNRDTAGYNAALNRFNTYTPFGSQEFNVTGTDPQTGAPIYEQRISMDPQQEQIYRQQQGQNLQLGEAGDQLASQVKTQAPFSLGGLPERGQIDREGLPGLPGAGDLEGFRNRSEQALYDRNTAYLDPRFERGEEQLRSRLANQGVVEGSEAYQNAMQDFGQQREMAYRQARNEAIAGGGTEAERMFGIGSQARGQLFGEEAAGADLSDRHRGQALAEMLTERNQPISQLGAIRGLTDPQMPQFAPPAQVGTGSPDVAGQYQNQYQGNLDIYNVSQQNRNNTTSALASLAAAGIALSDERAKEDAQEIGALNDGTTLFSYRYKGSPDTQVGVMAQEVEKKNPKAVKTIGGLKHVNYGRVLAQALEA